MPTPTMRYGQTYKIEKPLLATVSNGNKNIVQDLNNSSNRFDNVNRCTVNTALKELELPNNLRNLITMTMKASIQTISHPE